MRTLGKWTGCLSLIVFSVILHAGRNDSAQFPLEYRSIDGTGNNLLHSAWGSAEIPLLRLMSVGYEDGVEAPAGQTLASARLISNLCVDQEDSRLNEANASDFLWQWGQFIDHDLSLTGVIDPPESFNIPVPLGDPFFDPFGTGTQFIPLNRSFYQMIEGVRQQVNEITAFIDASMVYGSDEARALELRTLDDTGRLKTSRGELLPYNLNGFPNAPDSTDPSFFLAGDFRANEQVGLTAMHVLFVREHNFWAELFKRRFPGLSGEDIYQLSRAIVAAEMQVITYNEFLPILLGPDALGPYEGYRDNVNPGIANVFSTGAFRFGHSMLSPILLRLKKNGQPIPDGHLSLAEAFFSPDEIVQHGIDPLLRGLASQVAQEIDSQLVDAVRNFLFGPPGAGGFDLASLNLQRGRDHGLPPYNQVRIDLGLPPADGFEDVTSDPIIQSGLSVAYQRVDDLELWVGGLAEDHRSGALIGETFFTIIKNQFERLRDGDRFWYQSYLSPALIQLVERQTLATIIRRNTKIRSEIQDHPFIVP